MNRKEQLKEFDTWIKEMKTILTNKSADYSGKQDVLKNFKYAKCLGYNPLDGIVIRMSDKICRIAEFTKTGALKVEDEKIKDTLLDLSNYSFLYYLLFIDESNGNMDCPNDYHSEEYEYDKEHYRRTPYER